MMKKLVIGSLLGSFMFLNSACPVFAKETKPSTGNTPISITLVRPISSGALPGHEGEASGTPVYSPIVKPTMSQRLPKTNEQRTMFFSFLGFLLVGCSYLLYYFKNRKEEE
ncbi:LPXTG cell wall anchor domain-containing protein [Enterococcus faecium]|nr:LPXTG cell wall anchor domain-containing protein [Enterococcus faecium]